MKRRHLPDLTLLACFTFLRSFNLIDWALIALIVWMVAA